MQFQKHFNPIENIQCPEFSTIPVIFMSGTTSTVDNKSWRHTTDEDHRCRRKFWTLYVFYWIKVFFKLPFADSLSDIYIYTDTHTYISRQSRPTSWSILSCTQHVLSNVMHLTPPLLPWLCDLLIANSRHSCFTQLLFLLSISWRRTTEEDLRIGRKFLTLCAFYWINVSLKLHFAVLYIYIYIYVFDYYSAYCIWNCNTK